MAAYQSELIFNCTPAQLTIAMSTTLPNAGLVPIQAPIPFQGLVKSGAFTFTASTSTSVNLTAISSLAGLYVGMPVSGPGLQAGSKIATIGAVNTATLNLATTTTVAGNTITAAPNLGQVDFSYDGAYFLMFFGANPIPVVQQAQAGIVENNMNPTLIAAISGALLATLGAPVPPNLAVPPSGA